MGVLGRLRACACIFVHVFFDEIRSALQSCKDIYGSKQDQMDRDKFKTLAQKRVHYNKILLNTQHACSLMIKLSFECLFSTMGYLFKFRTM